MWQAALQSFALSRKWPVHISSTDARHILRSLSTQGRGADAVSLLSHPSKSSFDVDAWETLTRTCTPHLSGDQAVSMLLSSPYPENTSMAATVLSRISQPDALGSRGEQWMIGLRLHNRLATSGSKFQPTDRYYAVLTKILLQSSTGFGGGSAASTLPPAYARFIDVARRTTKRLGSSQEGNEEDLGAVVAALPETAPLVSSIVTLFGSSGRWDLSLQFLHRQHPAALSSRPAFHREVASLAGDWCTALSTFSSSTAPSSVQRDDAVTDALIQCLKNHGKGDIAAQLVLKFGKQANTDDVFEAKLNRRRAKELINISSSWKDALKLASFASLFSADGRSASVARSRCIQLMLVSGKADMVRDWWRAQLVEIAARNGGSLPAGPLKLTRKDFRRSLRRLIRLHDAEGLAFLVEVGLDHLSRLKTRARRRGSLSTIDEIHLNRQVKSAERLLSTVYVGWFLVLERIRLLPSGKSNPASSLTEPQVALLHRIVHNDLAIPEEIKIVVSRRLLQSGVFESDIYARLNLSSVHFNPDICDYRLLPQRYQTLKDTLLKNRNRDVAVEAQRLIVAMGCCLGDFGSLAGALTATPTADSIGADPYELLFQYLSTPKGSSGVGTAAPIPVELVALAVLQDGSLICGRSQEKRTEVQQKIAQASAKVLLNGAAARTVELIQELYYLRRGCHCTTKMAVSSWRRWIQRVTFSSLAGGSTTVSMTKEESFRFICDPFYELFKRPTLLNHGLVHCLERPELRWAQALNLVKGANGSCEPLSMCLALEVVQRGKPQERLGQLLKQFKFGATPWDRRWWVDFSCTISAILAPTRFQQDSLFSLSPLPPQTNDRSAVIIRRQCRAMYYLIQHSPPALSSLVMRGISLMSPQSRYFLSSLITLCDPERCRPGSIGMQEAEAAQFDFDTLVQAEGIKTQFQEPRSSPPSP